MHPAGFGLRPFLLRRVGVLGKAPPCAPPLARRHARTTFFCPTPQKTTPPGAPANTWRGKAPPLRSASGFRYAPSRIPATLPILSLSPFRFPHGGESSSLPLHFVLCPASAVTANQRQTPKTQISGVLRAGVQEPPVV